MKASQAPEISGYILRQSHNVLDIQLRFATRISGVVGSYKLNPTRIADASHLEEDLQVRWRVILSKKLCNRLILPLGTKDRPSDLDSLVSSEGECRLFAPPLLRNNLEESLV